MILGQLPTFNGIKIQIIQGVRGGSNKQALKSFEVDVTASLEHFW